MVEIPLLILISISLFAIVNPFVKVLRTRHTVKIDADKVGLLTVRWGNSLLFLQVSPESTYTNGEEMKAPAMSAAKNSVRPLGEDWPYLQYSRLELEELVTSERITPEKLHQLFKELAFRKRKGAVQLRELITIRLKELKSCFRWPTTDAAVGTGSLGPDVFRVGQGMLGFLGYRVGADGLSVHQRRSVLDFAYENTLPLVDSEAYMREWGSPNSSARLKKIANVLACLASNALRHDSDSYAVAIAEWKGDLQYLKKKYYLTRYTFSWPASAGLNLTKTAENQ